MALCPACQNALPDPTPGQCPNCGADLTALLGAAGEPPPPPPPPPGLPPPLPPGGGGRRPGGGTPWEDRDRIGILAGLVETTKQVLADPVAFFRAMPKSGGIGAPLLYAVLIGWLGVVASSLYSALFQSIVGSAFAPFAREAELAGAIGFAQSWVGFFVQSIFAPVVITIGVFLAAGIFHVMLLLLGGAPRDFEATFRAVCYSQAPAILMIVPFCGNFVAWIWTLVLYVIGVSEAQGVSRGRAAAAVLLPLLFLCCCCAGVILLFAGTIGALVSNAQ